MSIVKKMLHVGGVTAFGLGAGAVGATLPASLSAVAAQVAATAPITCSATGTSSCLNVTDTSSGVAVYGTSKSGTGLRGLSTSNNGLKATSSSSYGVYGQSATGAAGVFGTMANKVGILGSDTGTGIGVKGTSASGYGVLGQTSGTSSQTAGVTGNDLTTNQGTNDGVLGTVVNGGYGVEGMASDNALGGVHGSATDSIGVRGDSQSSFGLAGVSGSDIGVFGSGWIGAYGSGNTYGAEGVSTSGTGVYGSSGGSGSGVTAISNSGPGLSASSTSGDAVDAVTNGGVGVYVINGKGNAVDARGSYIGVVGRSNTYPLLLTNSSGSDVFYVDGSGNLFAHGSYGTFAATTHGGARSTAFTTRSTRPNVEDVGSARLINGSATIAFDPAFGASIEPAAAYQVFLTPGGDTRGLYVALKTPAGFVVHESQGGRGTLNFDYRVVAAAAGHASERMTLVSDTAAYEPHAPIVTRTMPKAPAPVPAPGRRSRPRR